MEIRYSGEEYKAIVSDFIDKSDWVIEIDLTIFLQHIFEELKIREIGSYFFDCCLLALEEAEILPIDNDRDVEDGGWRSFINEEGEKSFILSADDISEFKRKIIQQYSKRGRSPIDDGLRKKIFERDGFRCRRCESILDLVIDHIYPHSLGGADSEENFQTLCRPCNSRKGAKVVKP